MPKLKLILIFLPVILGGLIAFWVSGFIGARPRPHILLITLDTTRWDHLSCYGYEEETTPAIDKLAEEGVRYEYALSPSSWTLPAHASIFTGVLPTYHGAHFVMTEANVERGLQLNTLDSRLPTLAEELKKAGYRTGAIIGGPLLHRSLGVARGFGYYYDGKLHAFGTQDFYRTAEETTNQAIKWLATYQPTWDVTPLFLFLNYYDPHNPYNAPAPWGNPEVTEDMYDIHNKRYDGVFRGRRDLTEDERKTLLSEYDAEIRFMDHNIGLLFDSMKQLGLYDSSLIIVTSDHGESFGEHRLLGHGHALYEELIRVPLIIKYPLRDRKQAVIKRPVSIMSIMPTILKYIGRPIPETVACGTLADREQALLAEIYRDSYWIERYGNRFDRDEKAAYEGEYKWIWRSNANHELYNIAEDPEEHDNLRGRLPEVERHFHSQLNPLIEASKEIPKTAPPRLGPETERNLKALGYIQ